METLIGIVLAGLTELIKMLSAKIGRQATTAVIYSTVFLLALVYSYLQWLGFFKTETWTTAVQVFSGAIATYEVLIKRIIKPLLNN